MTKLSGLSSPSSSSSGISAGEERADSDGSKNGKYLNTSNTKKLNQNVKKQRYPVDNCAGDSSCFSSQELLPDERQPSQSKYLDACPSSQETYCSDIERIVDNTESNAITKRIHVFQTNYSNNSHESNVFTTTSQEYSESITSNDMLLDELGGKSKAVKLVEVSSSASSGFHSLSSQSEEHAKSDSNEINSDDMLNNINNNNNGNREKRGTKRKNKFSDTPSDDVSDNETFAKKLKTTFEEIDDNSPNDLCIICLSQPKNGAFVHNRCLHVCCCYRCSVKVWNKRKRCPLCNSQVKTVMKMFVH